MAAPRRRQTSLGLRKEQMRGVAKCLDRNYSDDKFERDWAEIQQLKRDRARGKKR